MLSWIKNFKKRKSQTGQSLVELLVAIGLSTLLLPAFLTGLAATRGGRAQQEQRLQATAHLKQTQEAVRSIAERGWSNIATNGTFHPTISNGQWVLSSGVQSISGFSLRVDITDTHRDSSGAIVESGGTLDPSTKKVVNNVSWTTPFISSISTTSYFTRHKNTSYLETTTSDFNAGVNQGTTVTNTSGGEVVLGAGGGGNWCSPNLSISALDLPKSGVANAISAIEGGAFAGTGDNASGVSYASVEISNSDPPVATVIGTFDGYKTNDGIFGETNYAYLATDTNSKEIVIVDLASTVNGKYSEAGYFDAPGNGNGQSVFVSNNIGYMTDGSGQLYTFDLSSKSGSRPQIGSITLAGVGTKIYVMGNYAYVSVSGTSEELQIIQVGSGGASLSVVGQANVSSQGAKDIFVNSTGTRVYLVTQTSATEREFFIIDISTKSGNRPVVGSYDTNGMSPKGVRTTTNNKAIVVGIGEEEYQVINIADEANPASCGSLNINSGINGLAAIIEADGDAYAYIITGDSTAEFKIIEGGPGGQFSTSGTFTSNYFDAGTTVAFNRLILNFVQPGQTTLNFQVAVSLPVSGSCANAVYYYVGPDGTSNTYFTSSGAIPVLTNAQGYTNPGQCIKYKAYFSTNDPGSSPILSDVSVNYSF